MTTHPLQEAAVAQEAKLAAQRQLDVYHLAESELTRLIPSLSHGTVNDVEGLLQIAASIVDALLEGDELIREVLSGRRGTALITNAINVAILSTKIGMGLTYSREDLEHLALAGLLHDAGMFSIPEQILTKPDQFNDSERELIQQHPDVGAEILSSLGDNYRWLTEIVLQAHERWEGQGYPNQLRGSDIHPFAQIIGLADTLDALISPRPHRERLLPYEAIRQIVLVEKGRFSHEIMKALVDQLTMYPLGTRVRLSSGEIGTVKALRCGQPLRPLVETRMQPEGGPELSKTIDLSTAKGLHIVEVLKPAVIT